MDLLVIGIDGGDQRIFEHMEMPFFHEILENNRSVKLQEDLWSRGWAEIFSGKLGKDTGAFYAKPDLIKANYRFTQSFKSTNYNDNSEVVPLWETLNKLGKKVGFMNFPTTAPLPEKLDGFMITGAGGGISQKGIGSAPIEACYPKKVKNILDDGGYIFDIRLIASGIKFLSSLIENLIKMHTKRIDNFIEMQKKYPVDIGGIAFMSTTRIQYLAMYEIENYISNKDYVSESITLINKLYASLDENLRRLIKEVSPKEFMIVSDHGSASRRGTINLNQFLKEFGYLSFEAEIKRFSKRISNKLNQLTGKKPKYGLPIDPMSTKAFTGRYISGIYINDDKRFEGPIKEQEIDQIVNEIVKDFNKFPLTKKHGLSARPYRRNYKGAFKYDLLPDIWVDRPDSLFFEAKGKFVEENQEYGPIGESLKYVKRDQFTGTKGRYPLFITSPGLYEFIQEDDEKNLTLAYKVIKRFFEKNV